MLEDENFNIPVEEKAEESVEKKPYLKTRKQMEKQKFSEKASKKSVFLKMFLMSVVLQIPTLLAYIITRIMVILNSGEGFGGWVIIIAFLFSLISFVLNVILGWKFCKEKEQSILLCCVVLPFVASLLLAIIYIAVFGSVIFLLFSFLFSLIF